MGFTSTFFGGFRSFLWMFPPIQWTQIAWSQAGEVLDPADFAGEDLSAEQAGPRSVDAGFSENNIGETMKRW